MSAKAAVRHNKEYQLYYRKKQREGKPHFLIMNYVMNKLLRTVYSVVTNKTPYSRDYIYLDPREKNVNSTEKMWPENLQFNRVYRRIYPSSYYINLPLSLDTKI